MNKTVRVLLSDAQLPDSFHDYAFDYAQDGRALLPAREPPHQCPLGRLLGDKVNGTAPKGYSPTDSWDRR